MVSDFPFIHGQADRSGYPHHDDARGRAGGTAARGGAGRPHRAGIGARRGPRSHRHRGDLLPPHASGLWKDAAGLQWLQTSFAGMDSLLTLAEARRYPAVFTNVHIHAHCMAEHLWGMALMLTRNLHASLRAQETGQWRPRSSPTGWRRWWEKHCALPGWASSARTAPRSAEHSACTSSASAGRGAPIRRWTRWSGPGSAARHSRAHGSSCSSCRRRGTREASWAGPSWTR